MSRFVRVAGPGGMLSRIGKPKQIYPPLSSRRGAGLGSAVGLPRFLKTTYNQRIVNPFTTKIIKIIGT